MRSLLLIFSLFISQSLWANWTFNLGYQNPPGALVGANFFYFGSSWGTEIGIGWIDVENQSNENTDGNDDSKGNTLASTISGDANIKYFLTQGKIKPYLQGGLGVGISASAGDENQAHAGTGEFFGGIGLMGGSPSFYAYVSLLIINGASNGLFQAGIGVDL